MKRNINKVAIIGSGIMGSSIACHFANIGVNVLLLDIIPETLTHEEEKKADRFISIVIQFKIYSTTYIIQYIIYNE